MGVQPSRTRIFPDLIEISDDHTRVRVVYRVHMLWGAIPSGRLGTLPCFPLFGLPYRKAPVPVYPCGLERCSSHL